MKIQKDCKIETATTKDKSRKAFREPYLSSALKTINPPRKMNTYVLSKLDNIKTLTKRVTQSTYPRREGWTVVDSWPANDQPPTTSDVKPHNDWDRRNGRAG